MLDLRLVTESVPDLVLKQGDLGLEEGVRSAILVSLYTLHGWWADPAMGKPETNPRDRPAELRAYQASLQWLLDNGELESVEVLDDPDAPGNLLVVYNDGRAGRELHTPGIFPEFAVGDGAIPLTFGGESILTGRTWISA